MAKETSAPEEFYASALRELSVSGVPFMVGGAFAMGEYAGIHRDTKDLDVFCKAGDYPRLLNVLQAAGCQSEVTDATWLAKAFNGERYVDIIFSSANGLCPVDETWFEHAVPATLWEQKVSLVPAEEVIWTKICVQDRFRFDGADVLHILRQSGARLDWNRLLQRTEPIWEILLSHLVTFRFVYPSERDMIPDWVIAGLLERLQTQLSVPASHDRICRGVLLSRTQYLVDVDEWGYTPK